MKRIIRRMYLLLTLACLFGFAQAQTLEIHQMNVGQGDAALIIVRNVVKLDAAIAAAGVDISGLSADNRYARVYRAIEEGADLSGTVDYAILVDAGQGPAQADHIYTYMQSMGVEQPSAVALSHFHTDHVAGFKTLATKYAMTTTTAYARGGTTSAPKPSATSRANWKAITDRATAKEDISCNLTEIELKTDGTFPIKMTCTAANGLVMRAAANTRVASNDENNYSVSWVLQYGAFRFYTGGDLNGMEFTRGDLETPMIDAVAAADAAIFKNASNAAALNKGHICAFKANHHGGQESTNDYFLSVMKPKVALVSCGFSRSYYHPKIEVLKSLDSRAAYDDGAVARPNWDISSYRDADHPLLDPISVPNSIRNYFVTNIMTDRDPKMKDLAYANLYQKIGDLTATNGVIAGDIMLVVKDANIGTASTYAVYCNGEKPAKGVVTGTVKPAAPASGVYYYNCHTSDAPHNVDKYITNH